MAEVTNIQSPEQAQMWSWLSNWFGFNFPGGVGGTQTPVQQKPVRDAYAPGSQGTRDFNTDTRLWYQSQGQGGYQNTDTDTSTDDTGTVRTLGPLMEDIADQQEADRLNQYSGFTDYVTSQQPQTPQGAYGTTSTQAVSADDPNLPKRSDFADGPFGTTQYNRAVNQYVSQPNATIGGDAGATLGGGTIGQTGGTYPQFAQGGYGQGGYGQTQYQAPGGMWNLNQIPGINVGNYLNPNLLDANVGAAPNVSQFLDPSVFSGSLQGGPNAANYLNPNAFGNVQGGPNAANYLNPNAFGNLQQGPSASNYLNPNVFGNVQQGPNAANYLNPNVFNQGLQGGPNAANYLNPSSLSPQGNWMGNLDPNIQAGLWEPYNQGAQQLIETMGGGAGSAGAGFSGATGGALADYYGDASKNVGLQAWNMMQPSLQAQYGVGQQQFDTASQLWGANLGQQQLARQSAYDVGQQQLAQANQQWAANIGQQQRREEAGYDVGQQGLAQANQQWAANIGQEQLRQQAGYDVGQQNLAQANQRWAANVGQEQLQQQAGYDIGQQNLGLASQLWGANLGQQQLGRQAQYDIGQQQLGLGTDLWNYNTMFNRDAQQAAYGIGQQQLGFDQNLYNYGVAQSQAPLGLVNNLLGGTYPTPVIQQNQPGMSTGDYFMQSLPYLGMMMGGQ